MSDPASSSIKHPMGFHAKTSHRVNAVGFTPSFPFLLVAFGQKYAAGILSHGRERSQAAETAASHVNRYRVKIADFDSAATPLAH